MTAMRTWVAGVVVPALLVAVACAARAQDPAGGETTIEITDRVLVKDTVRLGINLCGDNYWDSGICRMRAAANFEGVRYRMCSWGPQQDENGVFLWFAPDESAWDYMKGRVRYTILGGPAKGTQGFVKNIERKVCPVDQQKRTLCYLTFDKTVPASPLMNAGGINGILLELDRPDQGTIGNTSNPDFWNAAQNDVAVGDVPPGSFGCAALWLKGTDKPAHYTWVPMWSNQADPNGTWRVRFWAKAKSGTPSFRVTSGGNANPEVPLAADWQRHDLTLELSDFPADSNVTIRFNVTGGDALVDDVEIWKEEGAGNPTPFRDHFVNVLKGLNPGVVRYLQMGGSDLETNLRPRLRQVHWSRNFADMTRGGRNDAAGYDFNLHDFYVLCEHVGADPWYCLPGTIHPDEMAFFMEYLGGAADTPGGRRRAELGHPEPWTKVFRNVYVEFGNEAWNPSGYATGSYNGADHWKDLIAAGKSSPHYNPRVVFVLGSQAGSSGVTRTVVQSSPNGDRVAVAPYIIHNLTKKQSDAFRGDDELFRWVFAFTIRRAHDPAGVMPKHFEYASAANMELAIYEHNYHTTHPSVKEDGAPIDVRNRYIASIGGAVNLLNDSLLMMKDLNLRSQCLFNLNQRSFREGVKLWGFVPGLDFRDQRYRPSYLAEQIANRVVGGDLVETVHGGAAPTFSGTGHFEDERNKTVTHDGFPAIWSYAFRDGTRRGLVLFNLDTKAARRVCLSFEGAAKGGAATAWRLAADSIAANNEPEGGDPQVALREERLDGFASGRAIDLPPHSMLGVRWETER